MATSLVFVYINIVQDVKYGCRCYNWTGWLHSPMKAYENTMKSFHNAMKKIKF